MLIDRLPSCVIWLSRRSVRAMHDAERDDDHTTANEMTQDGKSFKA